MGIMLILGALLPLRALSQVRTAPLLPILQLLHDAWRGVLNPELTHNISSVGRLLYT